MSIATEILHDVRDAVKSPAGVAAIGAAVLSGNPVTAAVAIIVKAAQDSLAKRLAAKDLTPTPEAYALRIQGSPVVKAALKDAGLAPNDGKTNALLVAIVKTTFVAEENDIRKLAKGI